jgi:hypothetical protein
MAYRDPWQDNALPIKSGNDFLVPDKPDNSATPRWGSNMLLFF